MIEPVAVRLGLWSWTPPGPWLGVPIGNFVGWAVIVGAYAYGAERWSSVEGWRSAIAARRAALAAACIAALIAVGLAWTRLGLERVFEDGRGWIAWGVVLLATVSCRWWPHASPGEAWRTSLPERARRGARPRRRNGCCSPWGSRSSWVRARSATSRSRWPPSGRILAVRTVASVRREIRPERTSRLAEQLLAGC